MYIHVKASEPCFSLKNVFFYKNRGLGQKSVRTGKSGKSGNLGGVRIGKSGGLRGQDLRSGDLDAKPVETGRSGEVWNPGPEFRARARAEFPRARGIPEFQFRDPDSRP